MYKPDLEDPFADLDAFSGLTEEEFAQLDALGGAAENQAVQTPQNHRKDAAVSSIEANMPDAEMHPSQRSVESFPSDFGGIRFSSLTAEDFARLDDGALGTAPTGANIPSVRDPGEPEIAIEVEVNESIVDGPVLPPQPVRKPWLLRSPMEQFRPRGILSVTDLVSPLWCEVQYDYGLRGRRSRPLERRPTSFKSSTGKVINVEKKVAEVNDVVTRQGLAVHKELEREIKFHEVEVEVTTEETRWALRLVNLIATFSGMMQDGFTREMPIFGIIEDTVVTGIIDEVVKEETSISPPSPNTNKRPRLASPSSDCESVSDDVEPTNVPQPPKTYTLRLKDSKTRGKRSLPSDDDSESGRFQLMVYRRLASQLLSTTPPYDFSPLWTKLGVDPSLVFPTKFLVQAGLIVSQDGFQSCSLNDLAESWHNLVERSNVVGVHPELELIYRLRPDDDFKGKRKAPSYRLPAEPPYPGVQEEDAELARAIKLSIEEAAAREAGNSGGSSTVNVDVVGVDEEEDLRKAIQLSLLDANATVEDQADELRIPAGPLNPPEGVHVHEIIGTKTFLHDDEQLNNHLIHIMKWWKGERKPQGVSLQRTYRCKFCEYHADCEWREAKAVEHQRKYLEAFLRKSK